MRLGVGAAHSSLRGLIRDMSAQIYKIQANCAAGEQETFRPFFASLHAVSDGRAESSCLLRTTAQKARGFCADGSNRSVYPAPANSSCSPPKLVWREVNYHAGRALQFPPW